MKALFLLERGAAASVLASLAALLASGFGLLGSYVASDAEAFAAVLFLHKGGGLGAYLRALHHHASFLVVAAGALGLMARYLRGRVPASPSAWWCALSAYLIVLTLSFTGLALPMDQNAYWGTLVRLGIVETAPLAGGLFADLLRGGGAWNAATLPRFLALHASILPLVLLGVLALLGWAARRGGEDPGPPPLWPGLAALAALMAVAALVGAPLEPRASPADTEYVARPEWYFLWLFQFGKYVEAAPWLRSLALPAAGLGFLVALPFLRHDRPRTRGLVVGGWCLAWVGLTALALHEDRALPPRPSYEQALRARAEKQYVDECESCHAASGRGDGSQARAFALKPPDFTSPDYWREARPEKMREVVRDGSGQDMPAFGKKLSDEEMDALVDLVRARWRPAGLP